MAELPRKLCGVVRNGVLTRTSIAGVDALFPAALGARLSDRFTPGLVRAAVLRFLRAVKGGRLVRRRDWWGANWVASLDVEVPVFGRDRLRWRRASGSGPAAVEVAPLAFAAASVVPGVAVRHAGWPDGPSLLFPDAEWRAFLAAVRAGEFNDVTTGGDGER